MQDNEKNVTDELNGEASETPETSETVKETKETAKKDQRSDKKRIAGMEKELEKVQKEKDELNEKYMRMLAEYDNFRKRSAKERDGIYTDAYTDALTAILPVLDNLERAEGCKDAEGLAKGLELTLKSFRDTLEKLGVKEIEAMGKPFDPNLHNAVMHIEDKNFGENEIADVLMKGYIKDEKVIRYAMVKVAN